MCLCCCVVCCGVLLCCGVLCCVLFCCVLLCCCVVCCCIVCCSVVCCCVCCSSRCCCCRECELVRERSWARWSILIAITVKSGDGSEHAIHFSRFLGLAYLCAIELSMKLGFVCF